MVDCLLLQFLINLFRNEKTIEHTKQSGNGSSPHIMYNDISHKIANEYRTITFKEMAEYMHFSEPYFSKVFHNIFGMTFTEYLNTVKIAVAIEKVKENKMNTTDIASACGFNTIRNFNRVFKKLSGYSPNELPLNYVFMYCLKNGCCLDPTLNCTIVLE
jgi:YesN/AraC family two-component response regulator